MPPKTSKKFIFSCTIGTFLEFFDYTLYGYFAGTIGNLFFPNERPALQLIAVWGVFSIGFLIRPLGALLIGNLADKRGRRKVLPFTIVFMAIPTAFIGILPTFAMAGWLSPILLLLCRLLQGIAMSAEYNGASIYILENSWQRPGFLGSLTPFAGGMGMLAASFLAYSFTHNLEGELSQWYWRLAFIIAGVSVGFVGWYRCMKLLIFKSCNDLNEYYRTH
jgi:MFS transporter, MHS family, proline/betaine transporter